MGWWRTMTGKTLGDGPLNVLDEHPESAQWKRLSDLPAEVRAAIVSEYLTDLNRLPTEAELQALLGFHRGDAAYGVAATITHPPREP